MTKIKLGVNENIKTVQKKERKILSTYSEGKEAKEMGRKKNTNWGLGNGHWFGFWRGRLYIFIWQGKVSNYAPLSVGYPCDLLSPLPYHSAKQQSLFLCLFHASNFLSDQKIVHHLCLIMDNLVYRILMTIINWYQYLTLLIVLRGNTHN